MSDEFYMPGLSHFENDNGWSGSRGLLCYEIEKPQEGRMRAVTWQGPFCRDYAVEDAEEIETIIKTALVEITTVLPTSVSLNMPGRNWAKCMKK